VPDGADTLDGGDGDDFVTGMLGADTVTGGNGNDDLFGGPGNDAVSGENGDDIVVGNFGSDALSGGNGDDILDGDIVDGETPAEDTNPNVDTCDGGNGTNELFFCELES
jgi:Ca2+-binding RTX toxin-like protein